MTTKLSSQCSPAEGGPPAECWATFTVDGQHGNLSYLTAGIVTLQADDPNACSYLWEVTSSPPHCDYILAGSTQPMAKLTLPGSGAYVVQLTVSKGDCVARDRAILWVATPRHLYRIPADGEALRFDGDEEWAGDLARVIQEVDWSLPTPEQKAALDGAHVPGEENPFATLDDLTGGSGTPCELTADEIAAIKEAEEPDADNPFITKEQLDGYLGADDKAAIVEAEGTPTAVNPFITKEQLDAYLDADDKAAIVEAEGTPSELNPFVTKEQLQSQVGEPLPPDDRDAIIHAEGTPKKQNPFVTKEQLDGYLDADDKAAIVEAEGTPTGENPFITKEQLDGYLDADDKAAIVEAEGTPSELNPFVTKEQLQNQVGEPLPPDDRDAIIHAKGTPKKQNPFVTKEQLDGYLDADDKAAIVEAEGTPTAVNPFITKEQLDGYLDADDKAAIVEAEGTPSELNPFVTTEQLQNQVGEPLPPDDRDAIIHAEGTPKKQNPFVTKEQLDGYLDADDRAAIVEAEGTPTGVNPFITKDQLDGYLDADDKAAIVEAEGTPSELNPFVTTEQLQSQVGEPLPPDDRDAIIHAEGTPKKQNPFVTKEQLDSYLDADDRAAIVEAEGTPTGVNPFITKEQLDGYLDADDKAAIVEAEGTPSELNPFVTKEQLQSQVGEPLPPDDRDAIIHAEGTPRKQNPFVTKEQLDGYLDADDKAAIVEADGTPSSGNPFVTVTQFETGLDAVALDPDQKAALDAAEQPSADNEFVTETRLVRASPTDLQKKAMDNASSPSDTNPFATLTDLGQAGVVIRTVAAGTLDLSVLHATTGNGLGGLEVVDILPERGVATLHFDGYERAQKDSYLIKTLPIREDAKTASSPPSDPLGFRQFIAVQLVEFNQRGFELQMIQPLHDISGLPALGPCMVEVSEILAGAPEPQPVRLEQAVKRYFTLIQQERYALAWPMLTRRFREDRDLTFERYARGWERSGPAILVGLHRCEVGPDHAKLMLDLDFPSEGPVEQRSTHLISFEFVRDEDAGHPRFGYWIIDDGQGVALCEEMQAILDRLTRAQRERLGPLQEPCTPEVTARFALQRFERGLLWRFEHPESLENIWVLYEPEADYMSGASWQRYVDDWPGVDEYSCEEARANDANGPVRGFGWLWCNDADVRQRLGDPLEPEVGSGDDPPYSQGVFFEGGAIFYKPERQDPLNTNDQGIVLFNGGGWRRIDLS